ncbi:hypothetical protein AWN76_007975 [Rhodothermaceae bacterium RA]|nr:hypothetical protein AWN76_007975 [Rhodothermaceae bacterium RA]
MSYRDNIEQERQKQAQEQTARILNERLEKIFDDPKAARRWFWELLQNARDVAHPKRGIRVRVELTEGDTPRLVFSHDGDVFTSRDLVRLTEQDSSKRDEVKEGRPRPIGRFGTGFLTTHLLSRKVELQGIVHDEGERPRQVRIPLDRSGNDIPALRAGVERTFEALAQLDAQPPLPGYVVGDFHTRFIYTLDENGLRVARQGIEDLHRCLPITLALNTAIQSVEVVHEHVCYRRSQEEPLGDGMAFVTVVKERAGSREDMSFVIVRGEATELVLPVTREGDRFQVLPLPDEMPRLFCAFPLIGSETFPVPVVINSMHFHPTEPRDGVRLGNVSNDKIEENKRLMREAVGLYRRLLTKTAAARWRDLHVLADVQPLRPHTMGTNSHEWFKVDVLEPIREHVRTVPLVETHAGEYRRLDDVRFPKAASPELRERLWELTASWAPEKVPVRDSIEAWNKVVWDHCPRLDYTRLTSTIHLWETLAKAVDVLGKSEDETLAWLNEVIELVSEHAPTLFKEKAIFPNQNGAFRRKHQVYIDDGIDEGLKDICEAMGHRLRGELLHPTIRAGVFNHQKRAAKEVAQDIENWVRERIKQNNRDPRVFRMLLNWFDEHPDEAEKLFPLYQDQHLLQTAEEARAIRLKAEKAERLETENLELKAELERLRTQLEGASATGILDPKDEALQAQLRLVAQEFRQIWDTVRSVIWEIPDPNRRRVYLTDLRQLLEERPELFHHVSQHAIESYLRWIGMVRRAKEAVRQQLASMPQYDVSGWMDDDRFPTIVTGVTYYGRLLTLVIRPADQDYIILYDEMEISILEGPDSELWIEGGSFPAQRFNLGKLVRWLGVNRLPLRIPAERPAVLYLS